MLHYLTDIQVFLCVIAETGLSGNHGCKATKGDIKSIICNQTYLKISSKLPLRASFDCRQM